MYLATEDGDVYVVRAGREFDLVARNDIGEPLFANPAMPGDLLIVRSVGHLYAFGTPR